MPKRQLPSRVRYDLANPVIAVRVSKDDYDKLDYLRQSEGASFAELLLRALEEKDTHVTLGRCSKCGKEYNWDLSTGNKNYLDKLVCKDHPLCKKCQPAKEDDTT